MIRSAVLSPTGVRAAFEARGDIFTLPAEKGQARNLTASPGVHDRSPAWSPDGAQIAWLSDASGEYQLMIGEQTGATKPRAIPLPSKAFFSAPAWSPRRQAAAARGQPSQPVERSTSRREPRRRSTPTPTTIQADDSTPRGRRTRDGWPTRRASTATCGRSFCIRSPSARRIRSPTDCRTPSHRPSTRAASISTFWRARTTRCGPVGSR